ncbi:MAG: TonB-dependent receptor [Bacteroidia bacterium]
MLHFFSPSLKATAFVFFALFVSLSHAQSIRGKVIDENKKPLSYSSIDLYLLSDSSTVRWTQTDSLGKYSFTDLKPAVYLLEVKNYEYETQWFKVKLDSGESLRKVLQLSNKVDLISGGGIRIKKDALRQKNDTVEYNASNYKVNQDASAENLVTKMPGITTENGTIQAHGEDVKKVTVDGEDFFGDDASVALKNLPAEVIDKIQVYDQQSDQSQFTGVDDGNSQKTLNIVTKSAKNIGQFGKVYGGYGTDDRWAAGANINVFAGKQRFSFIGMSNNINQQNFSSQDIIGLTGDKGGRWRNGSYRGGGSAGNFLVDNNGGINTTNAFGMNYSYFGGKKFKLTASYFFNTSANVNESFLKRTYFLSSASNQLYQQGDTGNSSGNMHNLNARLEYTIDTMNSIIFRPSLKLQKSESSSSFLGSTNSQEVSLLNLSQSSSSSLFSGYNYSQSLLFRHKFKRVGQTLSLDLKGSVNNNSGESNLNSQNAYYQPSFSEDFFKQNSTSANDGYSFSPDLSYTHALSKKVLMELTYNPTFANSNTDKYTSRYDSLTGEYSTVDSILSNTFSNATNTQKAGMSYRYNSGKVSLDIGADAQSVEMLVDQSFPSTNKVEKSYFNVLPNARFTYAFSKSSNLRLSYRSRTNLPSATQLQEVLNNSNPLLLSSGNSNLNQEFENSLFVRYKTSNSKKERTFFIFSHLSTTSDYIANTTILARNDTTINGKIELKKGAQLTLPQNLEGYRRLRVFSMFGMPIKPIKSVLNFKLGETISRTPTLINGANNISINSTTTLGAVLASNISEDIDFTFNYSVNYSTVQNSLQKNLNTSYVIGNFNARVNYLPTSHLVFNADITNSSYNGLGNAFNQSIWLVNGGIGYKFLKGNRGELKLSVFDALKQNTSISRTVTETYIEDKNTQILTRFYMLTFTYSIRHFKVKSKIKAGEASSSSPRRRPTE